MSDKAKHAFGSSSGIEAALQAGKIDAFDILFLDGDTEPKVGWIDKNGNPVIVEGEEYVVKVTELPTSNGKEDVVYIYNNEAYIWDATNSKCVSICKPTDLTALEAEVATKANASEVEAGLAAKANASEVTELGVEVSKKVDAATVQAMIEEYSSAVIEVVEF